MTERLTPDGYEQTKRKLANLERRLAAARDRKDLSQSLRAEVVRSYYSMMRKYLRDIKLYEAALQGTQSSGNANAGKRS